MLHLHSNFGNFHVETLQDILHFVISTVLIEVGTLEKVLKMRLDFRKGSW